MKKFELEKLVFDKASKKVIGSGEKMSAIIDYDSLDLVGEVIQLKKIKDLFLVLSVEDFNFDVHKIKKRFTCSIYNE